MDPVVHFEMPYEDASRIAAFYSLRLDGKRKRLVHK